MRTVILWSLASVVLLFLELLGGLKAGISMSVICNILLIEFFLISLFFRPLEGFLAGAMRWSLAVGALGLCMTNYVNHQLSLIFSLFFLVFVAEGYKEMKRIWMAENANTVPLPGRIKPISYRFFVLIFITLVSLSWYTVVHIQDLKKLLHM